MARQIALAHGGQLEVSPHYPRGTAVELMLPGATARKLMTGGAE
ncbi:MAG: hypothetical protein ACRET0_07100 [Steroidobacteraceae bacterium]